MHVLNRLTFGLGEVDQVMAISEWIERRHLTMTRRGCESRFSPFRTLRMDTREIISRLSK